VRPSIPSRIGFPGRGHPTDRARHRSLESAFQTGLARSPKWLCDRPGLVRRRVRLASAPAGWMRSFVRWVWIPKRRGKMTRSLEILHRCFAEDVVEEWPTRSSSIRGQPDLLFMSVVGRHTPCVAPCASATAGFPPVSTRGPCGPRSLSCVKLWEAAGRTSPEVVA